MKINKPLAELLVLFNKFRTLPLERKLIGIFLVICAALPFTMVRSSLEIASHTLPLLMNYYVGIGLWYATGKPLWQIFFASYGIASVGIILFYLGTAGVQFGLGRATKWLGSKRESKYQKLNSFTEDKKKRIGEWFGKRSLWWIFGLLILPLPITDQAAAIAIKLREIQYGLWYLLAANFLRIYLTVLGIHLGIDWFLHFFS